MKKINKENRLVQFSIDGIIITIVILNNMIQGIDINLLKKNAKKIKCPRAFLPVYRQFNDYLRGKRASIDIPLDLKKLTPFQKMVYKAAVKIPYGKTASYQDIALKVGGKKYARAVGMALGRNPFPIIIPCHRVLSKNADSRHFGGFSSGLELKKKLLIMENPNIWE